MKEIFPRQTVFFCWHHNGWRRYSRRWWMHWFDWLELYRELRSVWRRGWYGYAPRDLWSLDYYLAAWLPYALRDFRERNAGYPSSLTPEQWEKELRLMEHGWIAAQHLHWECEHDCYAGKDHDAYWGRRWEYCSKIFMKRFFHLWY